ncbi:ABC transporter permease [Paenibacillus glufosinatiresistens]|uniref:ABC transporter permease n=1 Tax=Paenibacillus glufosinatiresistens TaxID=3070657 RepID=UPI00286D6CDC|nr:ABC transporter permease [Paenibacillus sp. YX.27]
MNRFDVRSQSSRLRAADGNAKHFRIAAVCAGVAAVLALLCLMAPLIVHYDPNRISLRELNRPPGGGHWLGTDKGGRDVGARLLYGGRTTLLIGAAATLLIGAIGTAVGLTAAYLGGWADAVLMRLTDLVLAFPFLIVVTVVKSLWPGGGVPALISVAGLLGWGGFARLIRARTLSEKHSDYVLAARALGAGPLRIMVRHLLPALLPVWTVQGVWTFASMLAAESSLGFLGFGVPAGEPSWGNMLAEAASLQTLRHEWWVWAPAGGCMVVMILAAHAVGEAWKTVYK